MSCADFIRMDAKKVFATYGDETIQRVKEIQSWIETSKYRQILRETKYADIGKKRRFFGTSITIGAIRFDVADGIVAYKTVMKKRRFGIW